MIASRLAALAALSLISFAPAAAQPAALTVTLQNFSFAPRPIHLRAGRPVTLTFVNRSGGGHDFTAKSFFASSRIIAGAAPGGEVELRGGETRSVTLVPRAGTYKAHCGHFMHKAFGMTDTIVVS
jgi:plastocyanin